MSLRDLKTNAAVGRDLLALLESGRIVHAFMFVGAPAPRLAAGRALARAILCERPSGGDSCGECASCRRFDNGNHEDLIFLDLEHSPGNAKTQIGVEAVEHMQERLRIKPFGKRHAALVDEAHMLNSAAQNKLLKTLEEPAGDSVIILLSERREALLPTVVSRCSVYFLEDEGEVPDAKALEMATAFLRLRGRGAEFYRRRDCIRPLLEDKSDMRERAMSFLEVYEALLREVLVCPYGLGKPLLTKDIPELEQLYRSLGSEALSAEISETEEAMRSVKSGHNAGYALKKLCLCT